MLLGANGSGKSTVAHLANATLRPQKGTVLVNDKNTAVENDLLSIRAQVGMVGQDPETQIVSSRVIDDVAFGPENLGLPRQEIIKRVTEALAIVGLSGYEDRDPSTLSGGEQQRLVIADAYAMQPDYFVFDEPTSMLDGPHKKEVIRAIKRLRESGHGILHVSHNLEDCFEADRILVLFEGRLAFEGDFEALVRSREQWAIWGLAPTPLLKTELDLRARGRAIPFTSEIPVLAEALCLDMQGEADRDSLKSNERTKKGPLPTATLYCNEISYVYDEGLSSAYRALSDVSFSCDEGKLLLLAGPTGSGKSTLLRLLAGLYMVQEGVLSFQGSAPYPGITGYVFQLPERHLFAETVAEDVLFGPENQGLIGRSEEERPARRELLRAVLAAVGLDSESFAKRSPFELSGGQARRVAIAGILAMRPRLLLFDEPTAGLDASGREFIYRVIDEERLRGTLVIVVTHDLEEFLPRADEIVLLDKGCIQAHCSIDTLCASPALFVQTGLSMPPLLELSTIYGFTGEEEC